MVDLLFGRVPSVGRGVDVVNLLIFHCQFTNLHHLGSKETHTPTRVYWVYCVAALAVVAVVAVACFCCFWFCCCRCCCCCCRCRCRGCCRGRGRGRGRCRGRGRGRGLGRGCRCCCCCCRCRRRRRRRRRRRCCCCCCCRQFTTVQLLFGNSHQKSSPRGEWESRVLLVSRSRKTLLSSIAAVGSRSERRVAPTTCEALPRPSMFQCFAGTEKGSGDQWWQFGLTDVSRGSHCGGRKACTVVKVKVKTTL